MAVNCRKIFPRQLLPAVFCLLLLQPGRQAAAPSWENVKVGQILMLNRDLKSDQRLLPYRALISIGNGDSYKYRNVRKSIENLSRTGVFAGIEVKVKMRTDDLLDIYFILQNKPVIRTLRFSETDFISKRELRAAIYSLRANDLFEESKLAKAVEELQTLLKAKGYFNARISPRVDLDKNRSGCTIFFVITYGKIARIRQLLVQVNDDELARIITGYFANSVFYIQNEFAKKVEKTRKLLKKNLYYFPDIKVQEDFLDPERSVLNITIDIACGYKYNFVFQGMARQDAADRRGLGTPGFRKMGRRGKPGPAAELSEK